MPKEIKVIQVAFNLLDSEQRQWHEFVVGKPNSSGYIKRLIQRDIEGKNLPIQMQEAPQQKQTFSIEGWI